MALVAEGKNGTVLKAAQREECFGEEVSAATSRVEECERSELVAESIEALHNSPIHFFFENSIKLTAQIVEKKRVDNFMDILD